MPEGKAAIISCSTIRFEDGMMSPTRATPTLPSPARGGGQGGGLLTQTSALEARQDFGAEERQLVDIVDEGEGDAGQPGPAEIDQLRGHMVGIADDRQSAHPLRIPGANL